MRSNVEISQKDWKKFGTFLKKQNPKQHSLYFAKRLAEIKGKNIGIINY